MKNTRSTDIALLLIRLIFGFTMIYGHGWGKLMRLFSGEPIDFADPFGLGPVVSLVLATFAEFFCSLLLLLGWYTRWALIPLIITMLVAIFYAHWGDPFGRWEKALMYLTVYISLMLTGPGWYAVDSHFRKGI